MISCGRLSFIFIFSRQLEISLIKILSVNSSFKLYLGTISFSLATLTPTIGFTTSSLFPTFLNLPIKSYFSPILKVFLILMMLFS